MTGLLRSAGPVARTRNPLKPDESIFANRMGPDGLYPAGLPDGRPNTDPGMVRQDPGVTDLLQGTPGRPESLAPTRAADNHGYYQPAAERGAAGLLSQQFNPDGDGYDYDRAQAAGMQPATEGDNKGHWGSVVPVSDEERKRFNLQGEAYVILKGRNHPTFDKAVMGEMERGFEIIKLGDRYYSIPAENAGLNTE